MKELDEISDDELRQRIIDNNPKYQTWTQDCSKCEGSGKGRKASMHLSRTMKLRCPPCEGKGGFNIVVTVPSKHEGDTGYYRPLTVKEVAELMLNYPASLQILINGTDINMDITYKGSKVKLQPREVG